MVVGRQCKFNILSPPLEAHNLHILKPYTFGITLYSLI